MFYAASTIWLEIIRNPRKSHKTMIWRKKHLKGYLVQLDYEFFILLNTI